MDLFLWVCSPWADCRQQIHVPSLQASNRVGPIPFSPDPYVTKGTGITSCPQGPCAPKSSCCSSEQSHSEPLLCGCTSWLRIQSALRSNYLRWRVGREEPNKRGDLYLGRRGTVRGSRQIGRETWYLLAGTSRTEELSYELGI